MLDRFAIERLLCEASRRGSARARLRLHETGEHARERGGGRPTRPIEAGKRKRRSRRVDGDTDDVSPSNDAPR